MIGPCDAGAARVNARRGLGEEAGRKAPRALDDHVDDEDQQGEQGDAEEGEQADGESDLAQLSPALAAERSAGHAELDHVGGGRGRRRGHQS